MWTKKCAAELKKVRKEKLMQDRESKKNSAAARTNEAIEAMESLQSTLKTTLDIDDTIDWESLKNKSPVARLRRELK